MVAILKIVMLVICVTCRIVRGSRDSSTATAASPSPSPQPLPLPLYWKNPRVKSHACQLAPFFFYLLQSPTPPQYVFWYHNNRMINYDTTRGSVIVQTDPGPTQSRLTIRQAVESDTGNYTCSASNTKPASIFVFVTEGDKMAAIQRRKTSAAKRNLASMLVSAVVVVAGVVLAR